MTAPFMERGDPAYDQVRAVARLYDVTARLFPMDEDVVYWADLPQDVQSALVDGCAAIVSGLATAVRNATGIARRGQWEHGLICALQDREHGINSLSALEHIAPTPRDRRRAHVALVLLSLREDQRG